MRTPWGESQHTKEVAPGITVITTAGHGGYKLSPERRKEMPKLLSDIQTWAGGNWYEEDCDWAIVALAFPQFFPADAQEAALRTMKSYKPEVYKQLQSNLTPS